MSNTESDPAERVICDGPHDGSTDGVTDRPGADLELLEPREVPLGGPRSMLVRRALPGKHRRMVGAWCFADAYGPDRVRMEVPPHPHIGLQTVSWLVEGEVHHRDSLGSDAMVRPGQLYLMTAGRGIAHSEMSPADATGTLHGAQLWVALPGRDRSTEPAFESHAHLPRMERGGAVITVMIGELLGKRSPATAYTPLVGAELALSPGGMVTIPVRTDFEHAVLALADGVEVGGRPVQPGAMAYAAPGTRELTIRTAGGSTTSLLLGGAPFEEELVMWWNFVGRSHEDIAQARATWQQERGADRTSRPRFGIVQGHDGRTLPAPELPRLTLRPRPRHRDA